MKHRPLLSIIQFALSTGFLPFYAVFGYLPSFYQLLNRWHSTKFLPKFLKLAIFSKRRIYAVFWISTIKSPEKSHFSCDVVLNWFGYIILRVVFLFLVSMIYCNMTGIKMTDKITALYCRLSQNDMNGSLFLCSQFIVNYIRQSKYIGHRHTHKNRWKVSCICHTTSYLKLN